MIVYETNYFIYPIYLSYNPCLEMRSVLKRRLSKWMLKNGGGEILANCGINCDFKELVIFWHVSSLPKMVSLIELRSLDFQIRIWIVERFFIRLNIILLVMVTTNWLLSRNLLYKIEFRRLSKRYCRRKTICDILMKRQNRRWFKLVSTLNHKNQSMQSTEKTKYWKESKIHFLTNVNYDRKHQIWINFQMFQRKIIFHCNI